VNKTINTLVKGSFLMATTIMGRPALLELYRSWQGSRVRLDKSEGAVKDKNILGSAEAPLALPERLRTKTLEISR